MQNLTGEELFLKAINAYKAWCDCGKDFKDNWQLFEIWDQAVMDYADAVFIRRNQAVSHIVQAMGVLK
jgi:hypothetical protein